MQGHKVFGEVDNLPFRHRATDTVDHDVMIDFIHRLTISIPRASLEDIRHRILRVCHPSHRPVEVILGKDEDVRTIDSRNHRKLIEMYPSSRRVVEKLGMTGHWGLTELTPTLNCIPI